MISVVIPTFNEIKNPYFEKNLKALSARTDIDLICVDSHSTDGTVNILQKYDLRLFQISSENRAARLNAGIKQAKSDMILLLHPRSWVDGNGIEFLINNKSKLFWGAFTHKFDDAHFLLKFTSWYSNYIRGENTGIYYLDHCIFARKAILEDIGFLPEIPIFEDTELSKKLSRKYPARRLPYLATTSAVRFRTNGIWVQAILNQVMKLCYFFNVPYETMNKIYEKGLDLNNKYLN